MSDEHIWTLNGKTALITGASRGIGRAIALELARAGANVAVNCLTSEEEGRAVCQAIQELGRGSVLALGDTRKESDVNRIVDTVETELGQIDVLVNNAVLALCKPFLDYSVEEWEDQLTYKGLAYFLTSRRVLPAMLDRGEGVILNMLSTVALRGGEGELAYAATNGAAAALTRGLASEFGGRGIRVNALLVTWADNAFEPDNPEHTQFLSRFALGRVTRVEEAARLAVFLSSPAASGITGALIPVDAGFMCR
jgi:3-oxoacyl-[acyl-carrier protein] reductase